MSESETTGARWDRNYDDPDYIFGEAPNEFLRTRAHLLRPGMRVLVPGDGEGRNGVWLAEQGLLVTTVDASPRGVAKARALASRRGVAIEAHCADLADWSWPSAHYDAVVSIFLHFFPAVRPAMHARMLEALVPGGVLILEAYTPRQLERRKAGSQGGPPPEMLFEPADLARDFAAAEIVHLEEIETVLAEGKRHVGPSTVVQLIARRRP